MKHRWDDYVLSVGDAARDMWAALLGERNRKLLYVMGHGFDPRMCDGAAFILGCSGDGERDCLLLAYRGQDFLTKREEGAISQNLERLNTLFNSRGSVTELPITLRDESKRFVGAEEASTAVQRLRNVGDYDDVVIDVSATPRTIVLTILSHLLYLVDRLRKDDGKVVNLHVISVENPAVDDSIEQVGIDEAPTMLPHFVAEIDAEASAAQPRIWFPILGERRVDRLRKLNDYIRPNEICPVLPSPCVNPRRGDQLIDEYREVLFDALRVDPRNIIYASETNPFECYRQLQQSIRGYRSTLAVLGGCKAFVSPLSSRLLSVGALLACYELRESLPVGIAYVETHNYNLQKIDDNRAANVVHSLWIAGEAYYG